MTAAVVVAGNLLGVNTAGAATTYAVAGTIPIGFNPLAVAVDPSTHTTYLTHRGDSLVSALDEATGTVTATIPVGSYPNGLAVDPVTRSVYVINSGDDSVTVIDEVDNTVTANIPLGAHPYGVAIDTVTHTVYVTDSADSVAVIDEASDTVTATVKFTEEPVGGIAVDPGTHSAYVIGGDDSVSVIDETSNMVSATIDFDGDLDGIAVDTGTHTVYVTSGGGSIPPDEGFHSVIVISETTNTVTARLSVGQGDAVPYGVAVDSVNHTVYVTDVRYGLVFIIDGARKAATVTLTVGTAPYGVAFDPGSHTAYIANSGDTSLSAITTGQRIVFTSNPPQARSGGTYVVSASGGPSGSPVTFTIDQSSTPGVCTVSPSVNSSATVTFTGTNNCVIDADQAGGNGYAAAPTVEQTVHVNPVPGPQASRSVSADQTMAAFSVTTPTLNATRAGQLLVAYIQADGPRSPTQEVTSVSGGGPQWTMRARSNSTWGTTEVWSAFAAGRFNNTITAHFKYAYDSSITVVSYTNATTAPTAVSVGAGISGTSKVTVNPTKGESLIVASAHNWTTDSTPTPAAGQGFIHLDNDTRVHDTFWVQTTTRRTPTAKPVTLSDTIPANSRWTMAAVEISNSN